MLQRVGLFLRIPTFRFGRRGFGRSRSRRLIFLRQTANYRRRTLSTEFISVRFLLFLHIYFLYFNVFLLSLFLRCFGIVHPSRRFVLSLSLIVWARTKAENPGDGKRGRDFSLFHRVQTSFGPKWLVPYWRFFLHKESNRDMQLTTYFPLVPRLRISGIISPLPLTACSLTKYRDGFTNNCISDR